MIVVVGGFVYGGDNVGMMVMIWEFDFEVDVWNEVFVVFLNLRLMFGGVIYDDVYWFFGGSYGGEFGLVMIVLYWWGDDSVVVFLVNVGILIFWCLFGGVFYKGKYYIVGGFIEDFGIVDLVDVFDFEICFWFLINFFNVVCVFFSFVVVFGKLYLYGGFVSCDNYFVLVILFECYDFEKGIWMILLDEVLGMYMLMVMFGFVDCILFYGVNL